MKRAIDFVRGAVAKKDLVPILTNLHVYDGRIQASNGRLTIDTPCEDLQGYDFTVPHALFLKAIDSCDNEPELVITTDKITVKSGRFKATLPLSDSTQYPKQKPQTNPTPFTGLLASVKSLVPFIAEDAKNLWACGMQFRGGRLYATNNVSLISGIAPLMPTTINVPLFAIEEVIRIGIDPVQVACDENKITFIYPDGSWMQSVLFSNEWPDISAMLPQIGSLEEVPDGLAADIAKLLTFVPEKKKPYIKLNEEGVSTMEGDNSACCLDYVFPECYFHGDRLLEVINIATHIDLSLYPKPCPFYNEKRGLTGVVIGVKP